MMATAIEARGLEKTYPGPVRALDGLSFGVTAGTIFGLLGPNGAGKSTTVRILSTLSRPDRGEARVGGVDVLRDPDRVRRAIGVVGQRTGVDREATGRENLALQARVFGMAGREVRVRVGELLERFGLAESGDRVTSTYSGGMQRKLDVAMGLVHRPRVLMLDEPTAGLDPEARADLWAEISGFAASDGLTILLTTHYLEEADRLASRLAIVDKGRIVVEGTPDELKGQLRGDAVHVELSDGVEIGRAREQLELLGVGDVTVEGPIVRARVDRGATAVPRVLAALDAHGIRVASITVARPSLDDVYLRHVGHSYGQIQGIAR
jgi:ABC-2 type transport system ATP-binding protein